MAKTKLRKIHKITIHKNRWLIWAIAYIIFVGIALLGYLKVSSIVFDSDSSADNTFVSAHSYQDTRLSFGLRYPSTWAIEADSSNTVTFLPNDSLDSGVTMTVTSPTEEKSIRKELQISNETQISVDQIPAQQISNNLGNGYFETVVLATFDGKLYVIRGSDNFVKKLLLTFHFLPSSK